MPLFPLTALSTYGFTAKAAFAMAAALSITLGQRLTDLKSFGEIRTSHEYHDNSLLNLRVFLLFEHFRLGVNRVQSGVDLKPQAPPGTP